MPLDQDKIAELLPDNTTQQISPADLRESFSEVADAYDSVSVTSVRARATDNAGDGTVEGDVNASDFSGMAEPDPAPNTYVSIPDGSVVQIFHKGVAYFWAGPSGVSIGLGGSYTAQDYQFEVSGTMDHGELDGLDDDDHPQYHNDARGDARYQGQINALDTAMADHAHAGDDGTLQVSHSSLLSRYSANQHRIDNITDLEDTLQTLATDKLEITSFLNFGWVKACRLFASGNGAANPTIADSWNIASVARTGVGVYQITLQQSTFWGTPLTEANASLLISTKILSTINAHIEYIYYVSPGVYDAFVYELDPDGLGGKLVSTPYDLEAGDTLDVAGWVDAGDGTLPPTEAP